MAQRELYVSKGIQFVSSGRMPKVSNIDVTTCEHLGHAGRASKDLLDEVFNPEAGPVHGI